MKEILILVVKTSMTREHLINTIEYSFQSKFITVRQINTLQRSNSWTKSCIYSKFVLKKARNNKKCLEYVQPYLWY